MSNNNSPQGIFKYSEMNDVDRAYLVKLLITIFSGVVAGIISGIRQTNGVKGLTLGWMGLLIWIATVAGSSYLIKIKFDLRNMKDSQIARHGIVIGFFSYLFFWVVVFQYVGPF